MQEILEPKGKNKMIEQIDHIGIAVKSLEAGVKYYEDTLGLTCEGIEEVASQKVKTAFFHVGEVHLELLEATDPESPIAKFVEKKRGGEPPHCLPDGQHRGPAEAGLGGRSPVDPRGSVRGSGQQAGGLPAPEVDPRGFDGILRREGRLRPAALSHRGEAHHANRSKITERP